LDRKEDEVFQEPGGRIWGLLPGEKTPSVVDDKYNRYVMFDESVWSSVAAFHVMCTWVGDVACADKSRPSGNVGDVLS
jgi:hypothetical protein